MTNKSTVAADFDLTRQEDIDLLLDNRTKVFSELATLVLGTEALTGEFAVLLGLILGSQIAAEAGIQGFQAQIEELKFIIEQQSAEILNLSATK